jgi:hypothetical protein
MTRNMVRPFLVAMMPVKNEAQRYLKTVLAHLSEYVDQIVILDDASTDETPIICRAFSKVVRFRQLQESLFWKDEATLRKILWEMTVDLEPTWILALDADEIFESGIKADLPSITKQNSYFLVRFPVYHFWGDFHHYRVDGWWKPCSSQIACLFHYQKNSNYHWPDRKLHCGRFPVEACQLPATISKIRLLHLGYACKTEHHTKYERYLTADPEGRYCPLTHYHSIISGPVRLKKWTGEPLTI